MEARDEISEPPLSFYDLTTKMIPLKSWGRVHIIMINEGFECNA